MPFHPEMLILKTHKWQWSGIRHRAQIPREGIKKKRNDVGKKKTIPLVRSGARSRTKGCRKGRRGWPTRGSGGRAEKVWERTQEEAEETLAELISTGLDLIPLLLSTFLLLACDEQCCFEECGNINPF
ncbi:hypothetical protein TNCT_121801 [Trichonephila clavata]|uniref:Uncharacterized protein n=1 Tax=Trichonephila clavata TaxID=2740835 RepID=A0A8X6FXR2_TRICU|nr:hypothetical protein TNCT_121801 [Trichonephila clavata]